MAEPASSVAGGLLLTNHQRCFDALVSASDSTKDYATNGYLAKKPRRRMPAKEYTVQITQDSERCDVGSLSGVTDTMSAQGTQRRRWLKIRSSKRAMPEA